MRGFATIKNDGVFSLTWVVAWAAAYYVCLLSRGVYTDQFRLLFLGIWALWWGVGLLFAVSALRRGSMMNSLCGLGTVVAFIFFLRLLVFPRS